MYRICLQNYIIQRQRAATHGPKKFFKCYICHLELADDFGYVQQHIRSEEHLAKIGQINVLVEVLSILSTIPKSEQRVIVENAVTCSKNNPGSFYCHMCCCEVNELHKTLDHVRSDLHKENLRLKQLQKSQSMLELPAMKVEVCKAIVKGAPVQSSSKQGPISKKKIKSVFTHTRVCNLCNLSKRYFKNPMLVQCHVMQHLWKDIDFPLYSDILEFRWTDDKLIIKCLLCAYHSCDSLLVPNHLESQRHLDRLKIFSCVESNVIQKSLSSLVVNEASLRFFPTENIVTTSICNVCNTKLSSSTKRSLKEHMNGKKHRGLTAGYLVVSDESDNSPLDSDSYACFVCNLTFLTLRELLRHYSELDHKLKMGNFEKVHQHNLMDIYVSNGEPFIHCKLCNDQFPTLKAAVKHISREKHVANVQSSHKDPIRINNGAELFLNALQLRKSDSHLEMRSEIDVDVSDKCCKNLTISNLRSAKTPTSVTLRDQVQFDHKRFPEEKSFMSGNYGTNQESTVDASSDRQEIDARNAFLDDRNITSLKEKSTNCCIYSEIWNIYNIDSEVIRLLNVGVDLSIVGDSKRYCFLCQLTFPVNLPSLLEHLQSQIHITNFYNMEKEDDRCNGKIFTSLKLAKLLIKKESEDILICCICDRNTQIHNNYSQIVEHYKSAEHMKKSISLRKQAKVVNRQLSSMFRDAWYYAETFACKICKQEYNSDIQFVKHLQDPEHMKHVHQHDAVKLKFHLCPYCTKLWYGSSETHSVPCEDDLDKHMISGANASATFMREIDNLQGLFDSLNESMDSLIMESDEVQLVMIRGCEILSCLEETVKHSYPNARAYSFGSRVSFLGLTDSDMNIFLDCENQNYIVGCSKDKVQWYLANVCLELKNQTNIWTVFEILSKTREPMIKLLHEPSGVDCEILLLNGLKVEKSRLLGLYNAASPCCRRMILYLREWLKYLKCFPGSDDIMTTAIAWCVIFYLQVQGILPPVLDLVKQSNALKIIDGWECGFNEIVPQILPDFNFTEHLHGFFLYFARFDYQKFVACPYLGLVIAKHDFAHTDQLPVEMDIYKFRASANVNDVFEFNSPMCIQDPIDMSHNMTGHVNKSDLRRFRQYCVNSAQIMAQKPDF